MLISLIFPTLVYLTTAFVLKEKDDSDLNKIFINHTESEYQLQSAGALCSCENGHCVKDHRGKWKCACNPKFAVQEDFKCKECDCGNGNCFFNKIEQNGKFKYEKKCACNDGYAEKGAKCEECLCGENSKCEFEDDEKICYCKHGFAENKGKCTDCDCGGGGYCEFSNGVKNCSCYDGYINVGDTCKECDCGANSVCKFIQGAKACDCFPGFSFDLEKELCLPCDCGSKSKGCGFRDGIKKCLCKAGTKERDGQCEDICNVNSDCGNGGVCKSEINLKSCECSDGVSGDNCEFVDDCVDGRFTNCKGENGTCKYSLTQKVAVCECEGKQVLDSTSNTCKECDCGANSVCKFIQGAKTCDCFPGFSFELEKELCLPCDCGSKSKECGFRDGIKKCFCKAGTKERDGQCEDICNVNSDCENGGVCKSNVNLKSCECSDGVSGDNCEFVDDCVDGKFRNCNGENGTCKYSLTHKVAVCECDGRKALDSTSNTCKVCNCGDNSICRFIHGAKECDCDPGYSLDVQKESCLACNCGDKAEGCTFAGGSKHCFCKKRTKEKNGQCQDICSVDNDCENGGVCRTDDNLKFCECYVGISGDNCEWVDDCVDGRFKSCKGENGTCKYSFTNNEAVCECGGKTAFDSTSNICKACDCGDNAVCKFTLGIRTCYCNDGYSLDAEKCVACKCGDRSTGCLFSNGVKQCLCKVGAKEKDGKCEDICDKDSDCVNGGVCRFGESICECRRGTSGDNCEWVDECVTGKFKNCKAENGTCQYSLANEVAECECEGIKALDSTSNTCKECNCGKDAIDCSFAEGRKQCFCSDGYVEENGICKKEHPCEPSPCQFGHCIARERDFLCICEDPYTGRYCEISTCVETTCHGGRCKRNGSNEECICPIGHSVENGTCKKKYCVGKKCFDGKCVVLNDVETCVCPENYVAEEGGCRKVKCLDKTCNGGRCRVRSGNVEECVCPPGYVLMGDTCQVGECGIGTCYGGRCENKDGHLICVCAAGFHLEGIGCQETICVEQNCFGGQCRVVNDQEICTCLDGYFLKNDVCQRILCVEKNCFGGKCDIVNGTEVCSCPVGFAPQDDVCKAIPRVPMVE